MKKHICFLFAAMMLCGASMRMNATAVSPDQAKQLALQFLSEKQQQEPVRKLIRRATPSNEIVQPAVVLNAVNPAGQPYLYTVPLSEEGGFVLVSGDDRFAAVLGYSDGLYDEEEMPENMREWLQGYIDEMRYLESIGYEPSLAPRSTAAAKTPIEPMVSTSWSQGDPYNALCPIDNEYHSVTGCVATAMAQLINYHMQHYNAPTAIVTQIDEYETKSRGLTVAAIPAGTLLPDRALLMNTYDDSSTDEQKDAVARLMLYCGAAMQMDYTSGGSGAVTSHMGSALITYFGFDETSHYIARDDYSYANWIDVVYAELAASRPVVYSGRASGGGHAFIVDGYDIDDFFHINWGWNGSCDDYYALSVLNPDDDSQIGASSSSDGYSGQQGAIIGCQITGQAVLDECARLSPYLNYVVDDTIFFSAYNHMTEESVFEVGIGMMDAHGEVSLFGDYWTTASLPNGWGYSNAWNIVPTDIAYADMTMKLVIMSRVQGADEWCIAPNTSFMYVTASYDGEGVPHLTMHPIISLQSAGMAVPTSKFVNEKQKVQMSVTNNGDEFLGSLYLFISQTEEKGDYQAWSGMTLMPNHTEKMYFDWTPDTIGSYHLWVAMDEYGTMPLDSMTVTITNDPALEGKTLAITRLEFEGQDENSWTYDAATGMREVHVYADTLRGRLRVTNMLDVAYTDSVLLYFDMFNGTEFVQSTKWSRYTNSFQPNQSRNYTVNKKPSVVPTDNSYLIRIASYNRTKDPISEDLDAHMIIHMHHAKKNLTHEDISVQAIDDQMATGSPLTPEVVVMDGAADISSHCSFKYVNNTEVGTATVIIVAKPESREYTGSIRTTFAIQETLHGVTWPAIKDGEAVKILRDGRMYIQVGEKVYLVTGELVRP